MKKIQRIDAGAQLLHALLLILEWLGWCIVAPVVAVVVWASIEPHGNVWMPFALLTAIPFSLFGGWRVAKRPSIRRSFILAPFVIVCSVAAGLATAASVSALVALLFFLDQAP